MPDHQVVADMLMCLSDDNDEVRQAAVTLLAPLASDSPEVFAGITSCIQDSSRLVHAAAVLALSKVQPRIVTCLTQHKHSAGTHPLLPLLHLFPLLLCPFLYV
jgi:hypothetical protein